MGAFLQPGADHERGWEIGSGLGLVQAQNSNDLFYFNCHRADSAFIREATVRDPGARLADLFVSDEPVGNHELDSICALAGSRAGDLFRL